MRMQQADRFYNHITINVCLAFESCFEVKSTVPFLGIELTIFYYAAELVIIIFLLTKFA